MTAATKTPERWANDLSLILRQSRDADRFPIDAGQLALDYSKQRFPEGPITRVVGRGFDGFEGALIARKGTSEWGIGYSTTISTVGRKNFTIAHEFGHYLLHRTKYPGGFQCRPEDMATWDSEYNRVEAEANRFAASLLMPLDDFRVQLPDRRKADLIEIGDCAERYGVSLMAATLRWLSYTRRRAILVVSRDGFMLWARSSEPAFKSGAYFKTAGRGSIEVPEQAAVRVYASSIGSVPQVRHSSGVWLSEPVVEEALVSERHDISLSLLLLENSAPQSEVDDEPVDDLSEGIGKLKW